MRLLTKTTLYYITASLFIFFICGIVIYQMVKRLEEKKVKQELIDQMHRFSHEFSKIKPNQQNITFISGGLIEIEHVNETGNTPMEFSDTLLFDKIRKSPAHFKKLTFYFQVQGSLFRTHIYKSMIESNHLIEQVALTITIIVIVFLLVVYFLYRYFFGRIWADFFDTIHKIQHFDINSPEKINFPDSMIIEFNELNKGLKKMIDRIHSDFKGLRDFTGNLTHEIQTPLAVIKSKTDLLIQDQDANNNQMILAQEINKETSRISGLIKALTLFTKLDNNQFPDKKEVNLEKLIRSKLEVFQDFIVAKELDLMVEAPTNLQVLMSPELADILVTNIIKNAIRHNIQNGKIRIQIGDKVLKIENTGQPIDFEPSLLFERFSKASKKSDSLGIGLSIAKKICDYYGFEIKYEYQEAIHTIIVTFE